jgi:transposase
MARELVDDELWEVVQPLLAVRRRKTHPGRKRLDDRRVLTGILVVLQSGIRWEMLPQEMGCGSGMTCWRRVRAWQKAGVWRKLHHVLLDKRRCADKLDFSRVVADSSSVIHPPNPSVFSDATHFLASGSKASSIPRAAMNDRLAGMPLTWPTGITSCGRPAWLAMALMASDAS